MSHASIESSINIGLSITDVLYLITSAPKSRWTTPTLGPFVTSFTLWHWGMTGVSGREWVVWYLHLSEYHVIVILEVCVPLTLGPGRPSPGTPWIPCEPVNPGGPFKQTHIFTPSSEGVSKLKVVTFFFCFMLFSCKETSTAKTVAKALHGYRVL